MLHILETLCWRSIYCDVWPRWENPCFMLS